MNTRLNRREALSVRFPCWSLTGVLILTAGICVGLVGSAPHSYHINVRTQRHYLRFEKLHGVILLLDERLTMSAHMAAATGEREWEDRYRRSEPLLDAAIKEVRLLEPHEDILRAADSTAAANLKLVEMDGASFPVELSLSGMEAQGQYKALGIVRDITERKRYESELKQARHEWL